MLNLYTATITTNASGAATVTLGSRCRGEIKYISLVAGTLAATTSGTISLVGANTGVPVLGSPTPVAFTTGVTAWYYPMAACNKVATGAASTILEVPVCLYLEGVTVTVAGGDNVKTGTINMLIDEQVIG